MNREYESRNRAFGFERIRNAERRLSTTTTITSVIGRAPFGIEIFLESVYIAVLTSLIMSVERRSSPLFSFFPNFYT